MLIPSGHMRPHRAPSCDSSEWGPAKLKSIHPTHKANALSALSAIGQIATLDLSPENQQEQATCNTDASSLQQQLSSWSVPVPQLQQQAPPQPGVDNTDQYPDLRTSASIAGSAPRSLLQVNTREVLGCGSTSIVFAGESAMLCALIEQFKLLQHRHSMVGRETIEFVPGASIFSTAV